MDVIPKRVVRILLAAALLAFPLRGHAQTTEPELNPNRVRSAMLVWSIGTNQPEGPTRMVETITRATFQGRPTWRITHYDHDPTGTATNDFDLYDVDAETLQPLRSVMHNPRLELVLSFGRDTMVVRRRSGSDSTVERIPLTTRVEPEGPGTEVFVASLPLRVGYRLRFHIVDRWSGTGAGRVKPMSLSVTGRSRATTALGRQDAFDVVIRPDDGSFRIALRVQARAPYYPLTVEYVRGAMRVVSEVTTMVFEGDEESSMR